MAFGTKSVIVLAFAATVMGHGTVQSFLTDGTFNQGFLLQYYYMEKNGQTPPPHAGWYAENLDNGFVDPSKYSSPDIICHKNARPATSTAKVAAGGKVDFQWTNWPQSHIGPVMTYVANCGGDCQKVDKTALKFVKIDEAGYDATKKTWAAVDMIANNNTWSTTVPSALAPGNYIFRHEIIALHAAGTENGAQNYPQCVNIEITGSGTENPEGVLATQLYTSKDAGILFNPYTTITKYEIPGPALFGSKSGTTPSNPPPSSTTPSTPATTTVVNGPTAAPSTTASPAPGGNVGNGGTALPETFTLDTFIAWLQKVGKPKGTTRRHARAF